MRRTVAKAFAICAGVLLLAGCTTGNNGTTQNPDGTTPSVNPTIPVTPVVPSSAPAALAQFTYTPGAKTPTATFTVPAGGFAITVTCKVKDKGEAAYLHYVANKTFTGDYGFVCDGGNQYQVLDRAAVKTAKLAGKKMTLAIPATTANRLTELTMRVTRN